MEPAADDPAGEAIFGGTPIGPDDYYGPARLLSAERVAAVHGALSAVDRTALRARYDAAALSAADIYPQIWDEEGEALDYLLENYEELRAFYAAAAAGGSAVLVAIM
jgi:hypothetical protein